MAQQATDAQKEQFAEQLLDAVEGTFTVFTTYLGDQLGYYDALAEVGRATEPETVALTPSELAERTDTDERYAREWLEGQVVAGVLDVDDPTAGPAKRRYTLPNAHAESLTDEESLDYIAGLLQVAVGSVLPVHAVVDAFRTGDGVPFEDYSPDLHEGQARMNRAAFLQQLGTEWVPTLSDVDDRLRTTGARVADVGCGFGYSCIGIAESYPDANVDGYDLDAESVEAARENVEAAGLGDRVTIHHRDAADPEIEGDYDLVLAFECLHDMSDPVGVLATMRRLVGDDGTVLVVDERAGDSFAERTEIEGLLYGFSVLHCLPVGMADQPSAATGTVMRADTVREYADEAGFSSVEVLPIENFFFRFYRLDP
ncbi:SAM-dependent methyltransferase [Halorussus halophilus]|uniref:SAM-dependent methyltransferase n=1 Tax=Halorussus halophilus TaxID=2650975 RepID=UPI0013011E4E|nr:methyltransferase domain-containing protein [Halorussus halophilus]